MGNLLTPVVIICFVVVLQVRNTHCNSTKHQNDPDFTNLDTLRLAQVMFRHGDRSPYTEYPTDPYNDEKYWPEGFKALTKKGKARALKLGQYLRRRYDGFLRRSYKAEELLLESSSSDRAIMTGLGVLAGLFPVNDESRWDSVINWQPIPIHTIADKDDNYINFKAPCRRFQELKRESFTVSDFARKVNEENQELYSFISQHTGLNVTDFELVSDLFDTLWIQKSNNFTLPEWTDRVYDEMEKLSALPYDSRVLVPTKEAKRIKGGPLLSKLLKNMKAAAVESSQSTDDERLKFYAIAGHDWPIATFLGSLDMFSPHVPGFASAVFVELHEDSKPEDADPDSKFIVKVFYKKSTELPPTQLQVPGCVTPCHLDKFKSLVNDLLLDGDEWIKACEAGSV